MLNPTKLQEKLLLITCTTLLVLAQARTIQSFCTFHQNQIRDEWRVVLAKNGTHLQLLRENVVKDGATILMICNNNDVTEVQCVNGRFNVTLPLPSCNNSLEPIINQTTDSTCDYSLYQVGFEFNYSKKDYFIETYRVCFDLNRMRAVYTINEAYPFFMPRPNGVQFHADNIFTLAYFSAFNQHEVYARFNYLLGPQQKFMGPKETDRRLDRGHLVPVADYMTNNMIRSTFKMINVIPQFHSINAGNWNVLEEWARHPDNTPAKVCSGALPQVLELPNAEGAKVPISLKDPDLIPVPLWTYKIVRNNRGHRTTFLQYNNIHDSRIPKIPSNMCQQVPCPTTVYLGNSTLYGYTVCCDSKQFLYSNVLFLKHEC